jgi:HlyD family type I secretion membrane fusion protein
MMATVLPISADPESKLELAKQLSGTSDRTGKRLWRIGAGATALLIAMAAFVPIDSGAMAPGMNQVENKRKTVQHLDGGMIQAIHVREGSAVKAGQPLITLDDTDARLNVSVYQAQSDALRAEQAALEAQLLGRSDIQFPPDLLKRSGDPLVASILRSQRAAFAARRDNVSGRKAQLDQQFAQLNQSISGGGAGAAARSEQLRLLDAEIADTQMLFDKGYATKPRLLALQRAAAQLRGERAALNADSAKLRTQQSEVRILALQADRESAAEAANALRTIQSQLAEVEDKLAAARQVLARTQIRAPVSGSVVGMRPTTVGGVIQSGEALMDVVPNGGRLIVVARVSPNDADKLGIGQTASIRFDGSGARDAPVIEGIVQKFSADALTDAKSGETYFEAEVVVAEETRRALPPELLKPGVPATVMIKTGRRTVLGYLFAPIQRASFRALREQ